MGGRVLYISTTCKYCIEHFLALDDLICFNNTRISMMVPMMVWSYKAFFFFKCFFSMATKDDSRRNRHLHLCNLPDVWYRSLLASCRFRFLGQRRFQHRKGQSKGEWVFLGNPKDSVWEDWGTLGKIFRESPPHPPETESWIFRDLNDSPGLWVSKHFGALIQAAPSP